MNMNMKKCGVAGVTGMASIALAIGSAGVAGAAPGSGSLGSLTGQDECGSSVVTPISMNGWGTPGDETPAKIKALAGAPSGDGALTFEPSDEGTSLYKQAGVPLDTLIGEDGMIPLGYQYTSSDQGPALQLRMTGASTEGDDPHFATIVWTPEPTSGEWAEADASDSDQFWVTRDIVDEDGATVLKKGARTSLDEIVQLNPDATLAAYGVQQTGDNTSTDVAVDDFVFGCQTTDFEPASAAGSLGSFGSLDVLGSLETADTE